MGNLLSDGVHNYSYDAEGNMVLLDGGANGKYDFDASNNCIRFSSFGNTYELLYDLGGKRVAGFDVNASGAVVEENAHIGAIQAWMKYGGWAGLRYPGTGLN